LRAGPSGSTREPSGVKSKAFSGQGFTMPSTFDTVAGIIAEICDIAPSKIRPESNVFRDLGIDSLDFLDAIFAVDKTFGIKLPIQEWSQDVTDGKATGDHYFMLKNLCASIDGLIAKKA
jgi:acyl carrier protein